MTPSVFKGVDARDELTLSKTPEGRKRIKQHRREFITKKDIKWIAENGFQAVRIPVGYWLFIDDETFVSGTKPLDDLLGWCDQYGLKVLICLHGASGSQNGHDHSGRIGEIKALTGQNYQKNLEIIEIITKRYLKHQSFWGIELMNEPNISGLNYFRALRFYRQAYRQIRRLSSELRVVFSDGYRPRLMNAALLFGRGAMMDIHQYHMATMVNAFSRRHMRWYLWRLKRRARLYRCLAKFQPIIIGEWSAVMGHELLKNEKMREADFWDEHIRLQEQTFGAAEAVFYWSYKTEGENAWNLRYLVDKRQIRCYNIKKYE